MVTVDKSANRSRERSFPSCHHTDEEEKSDIIVECLRILDAMSAADKQKFVEFALSELAEKKKGKEIKAFVQK